MSRSSARVSGFTLLELMIVVIIIAILAAIALPAYTQYVQRTRRSDGQSALLATQQAEEKFFFRCNRYGSLQEIATNAGTPTCTSAFAAGTAVSSPQGYYSVTISSLTGPGGLLGYVLTAAPQGIQATDPCANLSLDSTGVKNASGDPSFAADGDPKRCWH